MMNKEKEKILRIMGIRGIPASHGGFETFAQHLALYLADKGWRVVVYCQVDDPSEAGCDVWEGISRVKISAPDTPFGTILFDLKATLDAARRRDLCLVLGYNTAFFCGLLRVLSIVNIINMDGVEWKRSKWGFGAKIWFWLNERAGCYLGSHLIADHPKIEDHLATRISRNKITMIPYGGDYLESASSDLLIDYGVSEFNYISLIARPEPENSVLEIVRAFSRKKRGVKLLVLGSYKDGNDYHKEVMLSASDEVVFAGGVYDKSKLAAIRFYSLAYIHGHRVGGTNPSLVEALGAGNPVIAHDNEYNRWVAGDAGVYFSSEEDLDQLITLMVSGDLPLEKMRKLAKDRINNELNWPSVLLKYEEVFNRFLV